jgi:hypothetical protein
MATILVNITKLNGAAEPALPAKLVELALDADRVLTY